MHNTGERFFEQTKYPFLSESDQDKELPVPKLETPESGTPIDLVSPADLKVPAMPVMDAINRRRSRRKFSDKSLSLHDLSWLLWSTQGVKQKLPMSTLRTVPSAGARHPFDTYLAISNVQGLNPGLYRYLALSHQLVLIAEDKNFTAELAEVCHNQKWVVGAAVTFIWVAVPYRTTWRYSERGWRYLFLDAGHVCQNLYIASTAIDAACCALDAFDDDGLNKLLGLDGEKRFAIYLAPTGYK